MSTNRICCIIDLDGFYVNGRFLARELGWISYASGQNGRVGFDLRPYKNIMRWQDRDWNDKLTQEIHGLPFDPMPGEQTIPLEELESKILEIHSACCTYARNVVAFKGGNPEKDILKRISVPYLNIEDLRCPKYDDIKDPDCVVSCGYHIRNLHYSLAEVIAFRKWLLNRYG